MEKDKGFGEKTGAEENADVENKAPYTSAKNVFKIPTISVEESFSEPETNMSELIKVNVASINLDEKDESSSKGSGGGSLESIPSLDGESDSVSINYEGEDGDEESEVEERGGIGRFPKGLKRMSLGQVQLPSSVRRRARLRNGKGLRTAKSEEGRYEEIQAEELEKRLKALAKAFSARTIRAKAKIRQPPTPSSGESEAEDVKPGEPTLLDRLREIASPGPSDFGDSSRRKSVISLKVEGTFLENLEYFWNFLSCNYILDPQSSVYVGWLLLVSLFFAYNAWVIPLRVVFPYQTQQNEVAWFILDSIADFIYFVDVLVFKPHVKFILNGFWVKTPKETVKAYLRSMQFKIDLISLLPLDIFAHLFYKNTPILRIPRILKVNTFWELFRQLDSVLANPHRARIFHTCLYMLYMIHTVACFYYAVSTWEGIGTTSWTFDGIGNAYVRCFYFATKTATSIGKNPKPENELEYIFMTIAWLSGVFVFAILIGQIRDIIATATKSQTEYRILTSATVSYLHRLGVPGRLQERVKLWLSYTWEQQKTLDETRILNLLPKSMKAEIALNIHVETLGKVNLFQSCETAFLQDLVVKLRSIIILPGDFICRKGEIGREMFIVKSGKIQVIGGPGGTQVLATLGEGSVFGEIALLGIGGMNKRTADVRVFARAAGFVNLFVLNKSDLNDVIRDYPEAQEIMQKKAKKLMRESIKKAKATPKPDISDEEVSHTEESGVIIKNKERPPQLINAMMKLFPPSTKIGRYLRKGSKGGSETDNSGCDDDCEDDEEDGKLDDVYTSLTSYPPSPFLPISPGHISQQLDISVMTGDSLEKVFSRQNSWEIAEKTNEGETAENFESPFLKPEKERISSLPFPPESDFGKHTGLQGRNSCPGFTDSGQDREEIPIEMRPPLYLIDGRNAREVIQSPYPSSSSTSTKSKTVVQDSSLEFEEESLDETKLKTVSRQNAATMMIAATNFVTKMRMRKTLRRQGEFDIVEKEKVQTSPAQVDDSTSSYSVDIESD